jgi:hypothetical protein
MGGGNPLKKLDKKIIGSTLDSLTLGMAHDASKSFTNKVTGFVDSGIRDELSGKNDQLAKEAEAGKVDAFRKEGLRAEREQKEAGRQAFLAEDAARMQQGSKASTLLTGGTGLEDEEDPNASISRRMLAGR